VIKNLVKHGNSWALIIDRPILDLLNISPDSPVEITTDGRCITVSPVDEEGHKKQLRKASGKVNARYKKAFRKLAE
jgi:antitoxin MazE